jgi:hypothetical protein
MTTNNISTVRQILLDQMASLRSANNEQLQAEISRAKALSEVTQAITNASKVEIEYMRHAGSDKSTFLEARDVVEISDGPTAHNPFPRVVRHQLAG